MIHHNYIIDDTVSYGTTSTGTLFAMGEGSSPLFNFPSFLNSPRNQNHVSFVRCVLCRDAIQYGIIRKRHLFYFLQHHLPSLPITLDPTRTATPRLSSMSSPLLIPWTPFSVLPEASKTPSGLLQLDTEDHEVELLLITAATHTPLELRWENAEYDGQPLGSEFPPSHTQGSWSSRQDHLSLTLTTHRWIFSLVVVMPQNQVVSRFVHLSNVHTVQPSGGPTLRHPNASYKVIVSTYTYGDLIVSCANSKQARDSIVETCRTALSRKAWERATKFQEAQQATRLVTRRKVGVDHILTTRKLQHQRASQVAQTALSGDAEALLQEASALLQVIQKYTALLQKEAQQAQSSVDKDNDKDDETEQQADKLSTMLQDMGMTSGLTKDHFVVTSSGGGAMRRGRRRGSRKTTAQDAEHAYYEWLARQVVDFLLPRLSTSTSSSSSVPKNKNNNTGGIMSLTDVYCLFNRARGTNLISPQDLRTACELLPDLHLGITTKTFRSGIIVLQLEASQTRLDDLLKLCPITALEASHTLQVSPLLALEQLQDAEQDGHLCRDVTLETTRFYPNRFSEWI